MLEFDKKRLNIICGLIFIIISSSCITIIDKIKQASNQVNENTYHITIPDASNINIKQPVTIGGYNVGYVDNIKLGANNSPTLTIKVNKNITLPVDTGLYISDESLFSSKKLINLVAGIDENVLSNNDYIISSNLGIDFNTLINLIENFLQQNIN